MRDPDRYEGLYRMLLYLAAPAPHQTPIHAVPQRDIGNTRARFKALARARAFSSADQRRRRGVPVINSMRRYAPLMTVIKTRICHPDISALSSQWRCQPACDRGRVRCKLPCSILPISTRIVPPEAARGALFSAHGFLSTAFASVLIGFRAVVGTSFVQEH